MASVIQSYNYSISMTYVLNNKEYEILDESIKNLITSYDYETKNMPIIYIGIKIKTDLFNIMVKNANDGDIILSVYRYIEKGDTINKRTPYIRSSFSYFMTSDLNYNKTLEKSAETTNSYSVCTIGLYDMTLINENYINANTIIKNSDMLSIVHNFTSHMNMIIEPFSNNEKISLCVIPPINTLTSLLDYLNRVHNFYNTSYRYFRDFNKTYLLSTEGNSVISSEEDYSTIIIRIMDTVEIETKILSMEIDRTQHAYIIYIDANFTNMNIDRLKDKRYNKIIGIDSYGNTNQEDLNVPKNHVYQERCTYQRLPYDNIEYNKVMKDNIENTSIILNINKTEIDSALLTPNKEYLVQNYSSYDEYNGNYLLAYKKEIIVKQDDRYISNTLFGLRKIMK